MSKILDLCKVFWFVFIFPWIIDNKSQALQPEVSSYRPLILWQEDLLYLRVSIFCNMQPSSFLQLEILPWKKEADMELNVPDSGRVLFSIWISYMPSFWQRGPSGTPVSAHWLNPGSTRPLQTSRSVLIILPSYRQQGPAGLVSRGAVQSASVTGHVTSWKPTAQSAEPNPYTSSVSRGHPPSWLSAVFTSQRASAEVAAEWVVIINDSESVTL